jgi:hypothetical protein
MPKRARLVALVPLALAIVAPACIFPFDSEECEPEVVLVTVADADRDGYVEPQDCDESRADVHEGAFDWPDDGVDQDCDGVDASARGFEHACRVARPAVFGSNFGDTSRSGVDASAPCWPTSGGVVVLELVPTAGAELARVTISLRSERAHVLQVRASCLSAAAPLLCTPFGEDLHELDVEPGAPVYVIVSAVGEGGAFELEARQQPLR